MTIEFDDEGEVLDGIAEKTRMVIEEVGSYAYEIMGSLFIENLGQFYREKAEEAMADLEGDGILESKVAFDGTVWYRVVPEDERG